MSLLASATRHAERLSARFPHHLVPRGIVKFLAVGLIGLAVHTTGFTLLFHLHVDRSLAWLMALATATLCTWALNRRHTFARTGRGRRAEAVRYVIVTVVSQSTSFIVFQVACRLAPHVPPTAFVVLGSAVATLFSYTGQRFFTFAPAKPELGASAPTLSNP